MNRIRSIHGIVLVTGIAMLCGCASTGGQGKSSIFASKTTQPTKNYTQEISLARLSERNGNHTSAKKIYRHILNESPEHQVAQHRMGVIAGREGDYDVAIELLVKASKQGDNAEIYSDLGYVHYLKHDLENAEQAIATALQIDPDHKSAQTNMGILLAEQGRDQEALRLFRRTTSEAEALNNLAYIQCQRGDFQLAEQNYHRALEVNPRLKPAAEALVQLAQVMGSTPDRRAPTTHPIPTREQPQQERLAYAPTETPARNQPVAGPPSARVASNPMRNDNAANRPEATQPPQTQLTQNVPTPTYPTTHSKLDFSRAPEVQPVQYRPGPTDSAANGNRETPMVENSGLTIPSDSMGNMPAVYQISDQSEPVRVTRPRVSATEVGNVQSSSSVDFSNRLFDSLKSAANTQ